MKDIFENNENVEIEVLPVKKKKRKLTEKQLDNLRIGREKMKAKRERLKEEKEEREKLKNEKVAVKENVKIKKVVKRERKTNMKAQEEARKHRESLLKKKEAETVLKTQADRLSHFEDLRSKWLQKTTTIEEYDTVEKELDSIPEEVIIDEDTLETTLLDIMKKYKGELEQ